MATVRMSKTLVDQILENFKKQCATAYADSSGVGDFVNDVHRSLHDDMFFTIIKEHENYKALVDDYRQQKGEDQTSYWDRHINIPGFPFSIVNSVWFVVNPARPDYENRSQLKEWSMETYSNEAEEHREVWEAENFVEGDELISLPITTGMTIINEYDNEFEGLPFHKKPDDSRNYRLHDDFKHKNVSASWPVIISTDSDVEKIRTVAAGTFKIKQAVEDMENYLKQLTTLKQFVDNWSGGSELVPDEYLQKLNKKVVRTKAAEIKVPVISEDLKSDVNAAILENKLIGES